MKVSFRFNRCYRQTSIRKKNIFRKNEGGINGGIYRRCDRQFAKFFFNLHFLQPQDTQKKKKKNYRFPIKQTKIAFKET